MNKYFSINIVKLFILIISIPGIVNANQQQGIKLYQYACSNCHAPDKAKTIKAPEAFDASAWQKRFEKAKKEVADFKFKTTDDYFLYQVLMGKGLMHHGGLCEESRLKHPSLNCSDDAYMQAIHYMSHRKASKLAPH